MERDGSINEGHFIIFDRNPDKVWEEKIWYAEHKHNGCSNMVWSM